MALFVLAAFAAPATAAPTYKVLHAFCRDPLCPDGVSPSDLAADGAGNFYGTTRGGGALGDGTIFVLKRKPTGRYKFQTLYSFCSQTNCLDGDLPNGAPVVDTSGNLYGTTLAGGTSGYNGVVYMLQRGAGGTKLKVLHNFCPSGDNCPDGAEPMSALTYAAAATGAIYDGKAPLYGVAPFGGSAAFQGVVFRLTPGNKGGWKFQVLYTFCPDGGNCTDGAVPNGPLLPDASGNLFGMTYGGGSQGKGTVYQLNASGGVWSESVLYSFCQQANCVDGEQPYGGLALDASGALFGTTSVGGNSCSQSNIGCGVAFKLVPKGASWAQHVLHQFCSQPKCGDGATPIDAPYIAANGDLIGTAKFGGNASGLGVVWRISGKRYTALHKFCPQGNCAAGAVPAAALIPDGAGNLLGTTLNGGPNNGGVIYQITP